VVRLAGRLEREGLRVPEVSVGSTPTMAAADDLSGVTEIRPGNYVFFDAFQVAVGSATLADVAFTVAASVIGLHPERGAVVLDAGALALSKDAGPVHVDPGCGFWIVLDPETDAPLEAARLVMLSQEHGVVRVPSGFDWRRLHLGAVVRVVPNHSCLAAALFDHYHLVRGGEVIGTWRPTRGW
jgi:D-serine deaminase-like pyridoxal phosphate-dependent protein